MIKSLAEKPEKPEKPENMEGISLRQEKIVCSEAVQALPDEDGLAQDHERLLRLSSRICCYYGYEPNTMAEDFLNEAIISLYEGRCPADCEQNAYLSKRIRQLVSNHHKKEKRRKTSPREDIEEFFYDDNHNNEERLDHKMLSERICDGILAAVDKNKDEEVESLVLAYMEGHEKREDVLAVTGHTRTQHGAAKKRLETILRNLPSGLYDAGIKALGGNV